MLSSVPKRIVLKYFGSSNFKKENWIQVGQLVVKNQEVRMGGKLMLTTFSIGLPHSPGFLQLAVVL